jgi:hypothetical protein
LEWARSVRLQKRIQRRHNWNGHADCSGPTNDRALQRFDLDPFSLRQIDQQRRPHRSRNRGDICGDPIDDIRPNSHTFCARDALDLTTAFEKLLADFRIISERSDWQH